MESGKPLIAGHALGGRYRLDAPVARGGMAQVWRGTDLVLGRPVAIKVLHAHLAGDPAFAARFRREAQAAARLNDPHIVAIFDSVTEGDISAIILEFVDGETLRARLDAHPIEVHTAIGIAAQVADALQQAHAGGVIHRDIKPANVLLCRPDTTAESASPVPRVRVTDFGIAKALEDGPEIDLTKTGSILGTAKYLAPEQVQGAKVDARTDIYALGIVLYESVTGRVPWQGDSDLATAMARLHTAPIPPRQIRAEVPRELEGVILRALALEPADRYATAADFRAALLAADPGPPATTLDMPNIGEAPGFLQSERGWLVPASIIGVVVALLVAGGIYLGGTGAGRSLVNRARGSDDPPASTTVVVDAKVLSGLAASTYDARVMGGDNEENDDLAGYAVDGATTGDDVWRTECYYDDFSDIPKPGVGLVLSSATAATFDGVELRTKHGGWQASVYVSTRAAADLRAVALSEWGDPVAQLDGTATTATAAFTARPGQTLMVFFTSLSAVPRDDCFGVKPNTHRIEVIEAVVHGSR